MASTTWYQGGIRFRLLFIILFWTGGVYDCVRTYVRTYVRTGTQYVPGGHVQQWMTSFIARQINEHLESKGNNPFKILPDCFPQVVVTFYDKA